MINNFTTAHERARCIDSLKNGGVIESEIEEQFPWECALIRRMISEVPSERPSAEKILAYINNVAHRGSETTSQESSKTVGVTCEFRRLATPGTSVPSTGSKRSPELSGTIFETDNVSLPADYNSIHNREELISLLRQRDEELRLLKQKKAEC